jgi:hypothetical protein
MTSICSMGTAKVVIIQLRQERQVCYQSATRTPLIHTHTQHPAADQPACATNAPLAATWYNY